MVLGQFWSFVSLCFLVRLCLGFWIGISPSSFGRGFECRFLVNVLLRWCYSWGLSALISVWSRWQHEGGLPLHVVWWYLDMVWKKENLLVLVLAARLYRYSQDCVALFEHEIGLGVGPTWLMDVAIGDGPVTTDLFGNVCRGVGITTGHSIML